MSIKTRFLSWWKKLQTLKLCYHLVDGVPFKAGVYRIPNGLMKETPSSPSISGSLFDAALPPVANQRRVEPQKVGSQVSTHMHINKHAVWPKLRVIWGLWGREAEREGSFQAQRLHFALALKTLGVCVSISLPGWGQIIQGVSTILMRPQY